MKRIILLIFSIALALSSVTPASAKMPKPTTADYNVVLDFSLASNPNGVWSFGWIAKQGDPLILYTWSDYETCVAGMSYWGFYLGPCSALPGVGHNDTTQTICYSTWCDPVNYLTTHPGAEDELSVIRWTAPSSGTFLLQGAVIGLDYGGTDFHVVLNTTQYLFNIPNTTYHTPMRFQHSLTLSAGDTVDYVIGWGANGTYYGDSTGIQFKMTNTGTSESSVVALPEPERSRTRK